MRSGKRLPSGAKAGVIVELQAARRLKSYPSQNCDCMAEAAFPVDCFHDGLFVLQPLMFR